MVVLLQPQVWDIIDNEAVPERGLAIWYIVGALFPDEICY